MSTELVEHGGHAVEELLARLDVGDVYVAPSDGDAEASADFGVGTCGGGEPSEA